jgi:adenylate cyclase class 2
MLRYSNLVPGTALSTMMEVEVKLAVGPIEPEMRRLEKLGGRLVHARSLEENVLLDLPERALGMRGAMLRVRKYGAEAALTYKEFAPGPAGYKNRMEIEAAITEPHQLLRVLEFAGFRPIWRYMKYRTVFCVQDLKVLLDETPIGNYIELEGARESIDAFAARLGRGPSDYIPLSYRALYERWCLERRTAVGDMVLESRMTL